MSVHNEWERNRNRVGDLILLDGYLYIGDERTGRMRADIRL